MNPAPAALVDAARALTLHAASAGWTGPDPYDGLWWRWPQALVAGPRRRQVVVQLHARAPFDVRRIHRRAPARIAKTLALFGSAGIRFGTLTDDSAGRALALDALDTLAEDRTAGTRAWGYPFDVQTRWSYYAAGTPNVVVTAFAIIALLEGAQATGREDLAVRARDAARWVLDELWVEPEGFFGYHRGSRVNVHNASMLGAAAVSAALEDDTAAHHRVARAVDRVLSAQKSDGSWAYGDGGNLAWDDSFHTGYVLISLSRLRWIDPAVDVAVARGAGHYERFFDASGRATLWAGRRWPEDGHSAGTGLSALSALFAGGHVERGLLERVAARLLTAGLSGRTAVARRYRFGRTTVWYPRWCDGHVALGLADAATVLAGSTH